MAWRRRTVLQAVPLLAAMAPAAQAAIANIVVSCDTALEPVITAAVSSFRDASGINVDVFPTPSGLILPQLARDVQNAIVVTCTARLEQAGGMGLSARDRGLAPGATACLPAC